jgi:hypothetical protein
MSTQKSTQTSTQTQTIDAFSTYRQNVQKYFENISKITPQYFQSITHLQVECMKACEKTINASVSVQQEFAKKTGISTEIPRATKNAIIETKNQLWTLYLIILEESHKLKKLRPSQYLQNQLSSLPKIIHSKILRS